MNNVFSFILVFISFELMAHDHIPQKEKDHFGGGVGFRIFKNIKKVNIKLETESGSRYTSQSYSLSRFGFSYKLLNGLKLGAYYSYNKGLRHQDDWIVKNGKWLWDDTSNRVERLSEIKLVYKRRSSELSTNLFGIESLYQSNSFNGQSILKINPFIQKFVLSSGRPNWSFKISLPIYIPLNFDSEFLYKKGLYVSSVKHFSSNYMLSLSVRYLSESWSESQSTTDRAGERYTATDNRADLLLNMIIIL